MTEKKLPNAIGADAKVKSEKKADLPNSVSDPQIMLRLRKKRHLSGLMCPPMGVQAEDFTRDKNH